MGVLRTSTTETGSATEQGQPPARGKVEDRSEEPPGRGSRSAWLLAVCCIAQFMVILDLSIVNVALPSIQSSLNFSSAELQWVVDAYALSFAGFLMLAGRVADGFGQRRTFVAALILFALASCGRRSRADPRATDRGPCGAGFQLRVHGRLVACDHHLLVRARATASPRNRAVGGDERVGRRRRHPLGGCDHTRAELALGAADQPADRDRGGGGGLFGGDRASPRPGRRGVRRLGGDHPDRRSDRAGVRRRGGWAAWLELVFRARSDHHRIGGVGRVLRDRGQIRFRSAGPVQGADQAAARRQHDRGAVQRRAFPDVVPELALPTAGIWGSPR